MIKFVIAFDEKDAEIGEYCQFCQIDLVNYLQAEGYQDIHLIDSRLCNMAYIDLRLSQIDTNYFFVAYSHGTPNSLRCQGESYIQLNHNTDNLKTSFFYANACLAGSQLGREIECLAFIGFSEEVKFSKLHYELFVKCDNAIIKSFFSQDVTAFEAYKQALNYYNNAIDSLCSPLYCDVLAQGYLVSAREALVCYGKDRHSLTRQDLMNK
jgi:hypothetical protein